MKKGILAALFIVVLMAAVTAVSAQVAPGQAVLLGYYEQDNNAENGTEPIKWRVLEVDGNRALLLSEYALDALPYNRLYSGVTWETCSLRSWLNNDFYNTSFTDGEKKLILLTDVTNPDNPGYGTAGGDNTQDSVFLLSVEEAKRYFAEGPRLQCPATEYTKARAKANDPSIRFDDDDFWWWWLRTPGSRMQYGAVVNTNGVISGIGYHVNDAYVGIRPALWVIF